jgi:hypothetical protein
MLVAAILPPGLLFLPVLGVLAGLWLFARGLLAYRVGVRVGTIATSPVRGLAAGEVRVSGTVEPGSTLLVSRLQSAKCVHYHARVIEERGRYTKTVLDDARSVSFRVRDATGVVQVFPRGATWVLEPRLDERSALDGEPPTLDANAGPAMEAAPADREAQIAELLTVHGAGDPDESLFERTVGAGSSGAGSLGVSLLGAPMAGAGSGLADALTGDEMPLLTGGRHYVEERVEPGDVVTIVATAMPFGQLGDGATDADQAPLDDPEIAADLASAAAAGALHARADDAWGNAAIPGFGIGRPTRAPALDPAAIPEPVVTSPAVASTGSARPADTATQGAPVAPQFGPDDLVLAAGTTPMTVLGGGPVEAVERETSRFWTGMAGAVLAVACAAVLVLQIGGH